MDAFSSDRLGAPASAGGPSWTRDPAAPRGVAEPPALAGCESVRLLGEGSAGTVWLVRELSSGFHFAAKLLECPAGHRGGDLLSDAQKEVRIARAHTHEHVLPVHRAVAATVGEGADLREGVAIFSDYAPGGSLGQLVRARGRLPAGECVTVVAPIAQALAALHRDGTAHGDVSPGNILFTVEGKPMLADFGLGRMVGDAASARGGTPGFIDPAADAGTAETLGMDDGALPGRADASRPAVLAAAADVFSLGAVAWFILTGEPPVRTEVRPPLPLLVPGVPAELAAAIEAALRDDPRQRPSADELARSVPRSARPASIDLAPAVDPSVLPELLTRRNEQDSGWRRGGGPRPAGGRARGRAGEGAFRGALVRAWARGPERGGQRGPEHAPRGLRHGRRALAAGGGAARRPRILLAAAAALVIAAALGCAWWAGTLGPAAAGTEEAAPGPGAPVHTASWAALPEALRRAAASPDPVQAVPALSEIRASAIAVQDRDLLGAVNAAGSDADVADTALLDRLASERQRLEGFSARMLAAALEPAPTAPAARASAAGGPGAAAVETVVVRVRIATTGYLVKDANGATVGERPAGVDQDLRVVLERHPEGWRVARIAGA